MTDPHTYRRVVSDILFLPLMGLQYLKRRLLHFRYSAIADIHKEASFRPGARIYNIRGQRSAIRVGAHTVIAGELLTFRHGGGIEIGQWCYVGEGTRIWSAQQVRIGDRVLIAHNVNIHDTNGHPLDARQRHQHYLEIIRRGHPPTIDGVKSTAVLIGDDAWIGFNAVILKGVAIGSNSIIAAGSLVTTDVPPDCLYIHGKIVPNRRPF